MTSTWPKCAACLLELQRSSCMLLRRLSGSAPAAVLWEHKAEVRALAFEDPWLTAALADGTLALLDVDAAMRARRSFSQRAQTAAGAAARVFALPSFSPHCVDISGQWLAAGERECSSMALLSACLQCKLPWQRLFVCFC